MHLVVFGSGSGTNLEALLRAHVQRNHLSEQLPLFEIKALFSDRLCRFQEIGFSSQIPVIYNSYSQFKKTTNPTDSDARYRYDQENLRLLLEASKRYGFSIDLIFLAGYMRLVHFPLLHHFQNKIINIHPADLTKLDEKGKREYVGAHAVQDALEAGESRTRSTVLLVDEGVDTGPIIVSGPWVPYEEGYPITSEKAKKHQEKQKVLSDFPSSLTAIEYISQGRIGLDNHKRIYADGIFQENGVDRSLCAIV